jgi:hypothetical protein
VGGGRGGGGGFLEVGEWNGTSWRVPAVVVCGNDSMLQGGTLCSSFCITAPTA